MEKFTLTDEWQSFVLEEPAVLQCDRGIAEIATGSAPAKGDGVKILGHRFDAPTFRAGLTIFFRKHSGNARIILMPI